MKKFITFLTLTALLLSACNNATVKTASTENSEVSDPLPSWNEGPTKTAIIEFVTGVTKEGGAQYVSPEARIATFDNDGTLWCEQPVAQLEFAAYQVKQMAVTIPSGRIRNPLNQCWKMIMNIW